MKFSGTVVSSSGLKKFDDAGKVSELALFNAIQGATMAVHEQAVRGLIKRSAGEKQTRYNPKREVVASKPGDPPNVDRGVFLRSVQFEFDRANMSGFVGTNDERGPHFEFGTRQMAARPWLLPAWQKAQKQIAAIFKRFKLDFK